MRRLHIHFLRSFSYYSVELGKSNMINQDVSVSNGLSLMRPAAFLRYRDTILWFPYHSITGTILLHDVPRITCRLHETITSLQEGLPLSRGDAAVK